MTSQILTANDFEDRPRRSEPYIHPSWLAKYLSGDRQCLYAMYGQANYQLPKQESTFDQERYKLRHQEALVPYAAQLRQEGYTVYTEDSNACKMTSRMGPVLSAQCDIVALREDEDVIVDIKTGRPAAKDIAQVKLYMAIVPAVRLHGIQDTPAGRLVYSDGVFDIDPSHITDEFKAQVQDIIRTVTLAEPPAPVPSAGECRFCPIAHLCSHKVDKVAEGEADWF